tara:strand:+ start:226 stop:1266 length:1041 start_codon:yes stop_codon:yes gene_type:complete
MAYITFQPHDYFNTKLYTGNGSTNAITGVGFQPDWVWIKRRELIDHVLYDAVRGVTKHWHSNTTDGEDTQADGLTAFGTDGFTVGADTKSNANAGTYAAWNWKANGQGSSNTDGSINTTYTSANTTSGFSIIKYNGNGSNGATIGHGLGAAPKCVIIKRMDTTSSPIFATHALGFNKFLYLNNGDALTTNSGPFNNTAPSNSVITLGTWNDVNNSSGTYICYAFAEKKGFSKFGEYKGNNSSDGAFIYTGFKPAFVMIKNHATGSRFWTMLDNRRSSIGGRNPNDKWLYANSNEAEANQASNPSDFLSNGFKLRSNAGYTNNGSYIYMAFAEEPIVASNNDVATAV